jgi:hypothetical protein
MDDAPSMRVPERFAERQPNADGLGRVQHLPRRQDAAEGATLQQLQREVGDPQVVRACVEHLDDIGLLREHQSSRLSQQPRGLLAETSVPRSDQLDGHAPTGNRLFRLEHGPPSSVRDHST